MTTRYEFPEGLADEEPAPRRSPRLLLLGLFSFLFIGGGIFWGFFFVSRVDAALGIAGQRMLGTARPLAPASPAAPIASLVPFLAVPTATPVVEEEPEWAGTERINILLLGVDQRRDERERGDPVRSDTMMIVSIDPVAKSAAMLSIPRDMWVPIPVDSNRPIEAKITVAHFFGDYFKYPGGGAALAKKTVEYNLGVRIHYYAKVNFDGFRRVVDALDGIDICVPRRIVDEEYPTEDYGTMMIVIPAGLNHFDGEHALQYARTRHADSDFGRAKRQQQVLLAIRDKALRLDLIPRIPQLTSEIGSLGETDIPVPEMIKLAQLGRQIPSENITNRTIEAPAVREFWTTDGQDALLPIRSEIKKIVADMILGTESEATPVATVPAKPVTDEETPAKVPPTPTPTDAVRAGAGC